MTADVRTVRTAAEQSLVDSFDQVLPALPGGSDLIQVGWF